MPGKTLTSGLLCLVLALSVLPVQATAQPREAERPSQSAADEENVPISRREASEIVRERYEGRILNIRLERDFWRLRLDNGGVVFNVLVNARTGEVSIPEE